QPPTPSNVTARRQSTRNDHSITTSQASTPSSINPSVAEEPGPALSNAPGQVAEQGLAPFDLSASLAYPAGGPLMWDWHSTMDFGDFAFYEPQGELAAPEMHPHHPVLSDFSTPFRVTSDTVTTTTLAANAATSVPTLSLSKSVSSAPQQQPDPTAEPGLKRATSKRKESESVPTVSTGLAATNNPNTTSGPTPSTAKRAKTTS